MRVSAVAVLALSAVTPALADPPDNFSRNIQMSAVTYNANDPLPQPAQRNPHDACMQMMERVFYMADPVNLSRAVDAHHELEMARDAFHAGDDYACQHHALRALDDRSAF